MLLITPKLDLLFSEVRSIYQHPYHYTYVLQRMDNYIYLYDEMTMENIGRTKVPILDNFKNIIFTDNFNIFCAYIEGK